MVEIAGGLLREALATMRECGAGRCECVCWLLSSLKDPDRIVEVVHPQHTASAGHYDIDEAWLHATWVSLAEDGRQVRAQMHTHPGAAYHSGRDDEFAAVQTPGFLSIVVPGFAQRSDDLTGAHVEEISETGAWRSVAAADRLVIA
jgi:hypothetical protein